MFGLSSVVFWLKELVYSLSEKGSFIKKKKNIYPKWMTQKIAFLKMEIISSVFSLCRKASYLDRNWIDVSVSSIVFMILLPCGMSKMAWKQLTEKDCRDHHDR